MKDKKILLIGAGLSTPVLIDYLLNHAEVYSWKLTIADKDVNMAMHRIGGRSRAEAVSFDVQDEKRVFSLVKDFDLVISMLPANLHTKVVEACIFHRVHMITASYNPVNSSVYDLQAKEKGILLLNEVGLDPGIDHMSAMELLDRIRLNGAEVVSFKSSTGGLVAPESDDNPWHYKFSWNPANVVKAGQNGAQYIENGEYKYIPYHQLFRRTESIHIDGYGDFETYPNRDSVKYRKAYSLDDIPTMYRGTIRGKGFCRSWDALVQLGLTSEGFVLNDAEYMTFNEFISSFLPSGSGNIRETLADYLGLEVSDEVISNLEWLGLFSAELTGMQSGTPAMILQNLLMEKWALQAADKDMIVMQHQVCTRSGDKTSTTTSTLVVEGKDNTYTAMAMTVGLPVAICAKMVLNGQIRLCGMHIPTHKEIYGHVLKELKDFGIQFVEKETVS